MDGSKMMKMNMVLGYLAGVIMLTNGQSAIAKTVSEQANNLPSKLMMARLQTTGTYVCNYWPESYSLYKPKYKVPAGVSFTLARNGTYTRTSPTKSGTYIYNASLGVIIFSNGTVSERSASIVTNPETGKPGFVFHPKDAKGRDRMKMYCDL
jgi:hypothetical protein